MVFFIVLMLINSELHAYLDGGSGGMIVQVILGVLAVGGAYMKMYWEKIKSFFQRKHKKDD